MNKAVRYVCACSEPSEIVRRDFLKIFVNLYGTSKWSPSTFSNKVGTIENYINPLIGDWKLNEITTKKLSAYYNDLLSVPEVPRANRKATGRCVQPANIKKIHDIIRCALNQAIRWEYIDTNKRNPASLATLPKVPKVKRKVWSVDTFREAIQQSDDDLLTICMHLAFSCSMRIGEITGLTWEDVVIDEQSIATNNARVIINKELSRVNAQAMQKLKEKDILKIFPTQKPHCTTRLVLKTPKTKTSVRKIFLPSTVAQMLLERKKQIDEMKELFGDEYLDYDLVFCHSSGRPMEGQVINRALKKLIQDNDLPDVVFHSFRHASITYKLKWNGGDMKSVQGDSGHARMDMVADVYSHIIDEDRRYNAQKFEEQFYNAKGLKNAEEGKTAPMPKFETSVELLDPMAEVQKGSEVEEEKPAENSADENAALLAKLLSNPDTAALLKALAKTI